MRSIGILMVLFSCVGLLAGPAPLPARAAARSITVDCDKGQDLALAIDKASRAGVKNIRILGTCHGNFRIAETALSLRGVSPEVSAIVGTVGDPAIEITAPGRSVIDKLSVRGENFGVKVVGHRAEVSIVDCRIHDNIVGVILDGGADSYIASTEVYGNELGIQLLNGSQSSVVESTIRDNTSHGLIARANSYLAITDSVVRGHGQVGILSAQTSWVAAAGTRFEDNGEIHAFARDRSKLTVRSGSLLGSAGDPTLFSVGVDDMSRLQVNSSVELHGDLLGSNFSYVTLSTSTLFGSMWLQDFTTARVGLSEIEGELSCSTGSDAYCGSGTVASTSGCDSAPAECGVARAQNESDEGDTSELQRSLDRWASE